MNDENNMSLDLIQSNRRFTMRWQGLHKTGDTIIVPTAFQVIKALGYRDQVFYICTPQDNSKRFVCLKNPVFVLRTENGGEVGTDDIPREVLDRAYNYTNAESGTDEEEEEE